MLIADEGFRRFPYLDSRKILTVGIGHNLDANGLSDTVINHIFEEDLDGAVRGCERAFPDFARFSIQRQLALTSMCFQLGYGGLLGFRKTIALIREGRFDEAAIEAANSKWAKVDSPKRAAKVIKMLKDG